MQKHFNKFIWVNFTFQERMSRFDFWIYGMLIWWFIFFPITIFLYTAFFSLNDTLLIIGALGIGGAYLLHTYAVTIKRLHDHNKSGWNILWTIIPILGAIIFLVIFIACGFIRGTVGENNFGKDPLE